MYDFFYNVLKKQYGEKCELLYTDKDSLLLEIETEDIYKDMEAKKDLYDTSDYPKEHPLHSNTNKKVLGKMKDESAGTLIAECVCLRQKSEGCKKERCQERNKTRTVQGTLFGAKQLSHGMNTLRSEGHEIYSMHINKISLSPFDSKRWIDEDGVKTKAYGYIDKLHTDEELAEMEAELSELLGW